MPKVSVIIPTYNMAVYLSEAIESVINQTFSDWELIIVDDGSKDRTRNVVEKYLTNNKIKYYYKKNGGLASARNLGIKLSLGMHIAFLDSDDIWLPEKLAIQVSFLENCSDVDLVFTPAYIKNTSGQINSIFANKLVGQKISGKRLFKALLQDSVSIIPSSVIIRREKAQVLFNENFRRVEDLIFFMEIGLLGASFYGLKDPLLIWRRGHESLSFTRLNIFEDTTRIIDALNSKDYNLPFSITEAKAHLYLNVAKNVLRSKLIDKQIGLRKKYLIYVRSLLESFFHYPANIYLYKHLMKDLPKKILGRN